MNPDYERRLEAEIQRELQRLPDLMAPASLAGRVLAALQAEAARPWYWRGWQAWPVSLRMASLAVLLAFFGGLCFGGSLLTHSPAAANAANTAGSWFAGLGAIWHVLQVLFDSAVLVVKQLGTGILIGCAVAMGLAYAVFVGLGTTCVRLALARR